MHDLYELVEELQQNAPESLAARVVQQRRVVWWSFTVDTWERTSARANRLAKNLNQLLSVDISLNDVHNTWELRVWHDLLKDRKGQRREKGTLTWWETAVKRVNEYLASPAYQPPDLPDLRSELKQSSTKALDDPSSLTNRFRQLLDN